MDNKEQDCLRTGLEDLRKGEADPERAEQLEARAQEEIRQAEQKLIEARHRDYVFFVGAERFVTPHEHLTRGRDQGDGPGLAGGRWFRAGRRGSRTEPLDRRPRDSALSQRSPCPLHQGATCDLRHAVMSEAIKAAHFGQLKARYSDATKQALPSGSSLIVIPRVPLPVGWNAPTTSVRFIEQAQYPFAAPDCFWVDEELRRANGQNPQSSAAQVIPGLSLTAFGSLGMSTADRNPSTDNHLTWMGCIAERLRKPQ